MESYDTNFDFSYFSGYIGFIIAGNQLFKTSRKFNIPMLVLVFIGAFIYTCLCTYLSSIKSNEIREGFMDNLSINVMLMAFSLFLIFKDKQYFVNPFMRKTIDIICKNSYGIYLSHILILNLFIRYGVSFLFVHPVLSIPILSFTSLLISCAVIMAMKKVPLLKSVAG